MVGRWAGTDTPAVGISLGIERILDLIPASAAIDNSLVLLVRDDASGALRSQAELIAQGWRVRLERQAKNTKAQLAELAAARFSHFAFFEEGGQLDIKPLS